MLVILAPLTFNEIRTNPPTPSQLTQKQRTDTEDGIAPDKDSAESWAESAAVVYSVHGGACFCSESCADLHESASSNFQYFK